MPHGHGSQVDPAQWTTVGSALQLKPFMPKALHELPCPEAISALAKGEEAFGQGHPDLVHTQEVLQLALGRKGWNWVPQPPKDRLLSSFLRLVVARSQDARDLPCRQPGRARPPQPSARPDAASRRGQQHPSALRAYCHHH